MKKILLLTLAISYGLQAITPAQPYDMEVNLEPIDFVNIPLGSESQTWVDKWSIVGGIAGAAAGAGTYLFLPDHMRSHQQPDVIDTMYGITATGVASAIGYFGSNWYATGCTLEKIEESKTNSLIFDHNAALKAFNIVNLSAHERARLSRLPFNKPTVDQDRLEVYQGIDIASSKNPINDRFTYIKDIAAKVDNEKNACTQLTAARIAQLRASSLVADAHTIAQTIEQQKAYIMSLNTLIPAQTMKNWCSYVEKQAPEFKAERLQTDCDIRYKQLLKDEENIKWYLARLAALYGYIFSQIDLSSSAWSFVIAGLSTDYSNTPEGRQARKRDIQDTKNHISRLIQNYQNKIIDYNNDVIDHNELQSNVYGPIAQFVMGQGGSTKSIKGLKANRRLLEYNNYLNHSDGCAFWNWVQSCFDN